MSMNSLNDAMADIPGLYPWHKEVWAHTVESFDRLPHAILITGTEGTGKFQFASKLGMALLCDNQQQELPCGQCRSCRFFGAATHPDLHVLTSEAKLQLLDSTMASYAERYLDDERTRSRRKVPRSAIVIAQIRALIQAANSKPHISSNKVFVVDPIDSMTISAANSLLKILEEPAPNTFLVLITENDQHLLPTIASRCQKLLISDPDRRTSREWLANQNIEANTIDAILESGKGPLVGLRRIRNDEIVKSSEFVNQVLQKLKNKQSNDIFSLVESGLQLGEVEPLDELHLLVSRFIVESVAGPQSSESAFEKIVNKVDIRNLYSIYDHIGYLRNELRIGGIDKTLAIEDALLTLENSIN